jgi:hypothetical protein
MMEEATGQTNQNPSEYVSNGVLPFPYHGTGADGTKCFDTYNGNTVSNNVVTEATGQAIPDATLHGYLSEGVRTNLLLQSAIPATQNITTTAQAYTISMWGTGTCTLSGTATGVLTGTGVGTRVELTVTATAGTLTLTFAGTNTKGQLEAGAFASSYIPTTTASVTRNADVLTYQTAGNFSDTEGTAYAEVTPTSWVNVTGQYLGDGTEAPLQASSSNMGVQAYDGTNTVSGPTGTPSGQKKVASSWKGFVLKGFSGGTKGADGAYDGAFTLAQLNIGSSFFGTIRNMRVWKKALTDSLLNKLTT